MGKLPALRTWCRPCLVRGCGPLGDAEPAARPSVWAATSVAVEEDPTGSQAFVAVMGKPPSEATAAWIRWVRAL